MKKIVKVFNRDELKEHLYHLDLEDENIYKEVNNKHSYNLFQMTGGTYKDLVRETKPNNWEEVNACNAMARPGTIKAKDDYLNGKKKIYKYALPIVNVLSETHSVCLYQEQAMSVFNVIGGFTLEETDVIRGLMKKLSKKDKKTEDLEKWAKAVERFSDNAKKMGLTDKQAKQITEDLVEFSSYSFNKSHCYAYSYVGIVTAYLSYYFRTHFFAASLNEEDRTEKTMIGLYSCKLNNIEILPPDINKSSDKFMALDSKSIIYGLTGIKNVGTKALEIISSNRPYKSFKDFILHPNLKNRAISSRAIESLIKAGCFDSLEGKESRKKLLQTLKLFWERKAQRVQHKMEQIYDESYKMVSELPFTENTLIDYEKWEEECFGFTFFTTKFTDSVFNFLKEKKATYYDFESIDDRPKPFLCYIKNIRTTIDKNKKEMAFIELSDDLGQTVLFPMFQSVWKEVKDLIEEGNVYLFILRKDEQERVQFGKVGFHNREENRKWLLNITRRLE